MATGAFTLFDKAKKKLSDGTIDLDSHSFRVVLCGSSQSLTAPFVGASGIARYSDLTAELASVNGYTLTGVALTNVTWVEASGVVTWNADDAVWTLTLPVTYKYGVIYDNSSANKDLLGFFDADTSSAAASVTPAAGVHTLVWDAAGIFTAS